MARVSKVETCIFCFCKPCACDGKSATKPVKVRLITSAPTQAAPEKRINPSLRAAMARMATDAPERPAMPSKPDQRPTVNPVTVLTATDEELIFEEAIRNLHAAGMLSHDDTERYRMILTSAQSPEDRLATWKAKRNAVDGNT